MSVYEIVTKNISLLQQGDDLPPEYAPFDTRP